MTRKRKLQIALMAALVATLALAPLGLLTYKLRNSTGVAGGSGGAIMQSAGYRLESSVGSGVLISASGGDYRLCSGFACDGLFAVNLPLTIR